MLHFISFGSGSSGNCYYLFNETDSLMIDVGVGIRTLKKHFRDYGLSLDDIQNVLITHNHADHIKSVGSISSKFDIDVYATARVHEGIRTNYYVKCKPASNHVKVLKKGVQTTIGAFKVTPFEVPHDSLDNVGYLITYEDLNFVIITDAGHVTDEMATYIAVADYLVMEANHDEQMLRNGPYPQVLKERIIGPNGHLSNKACGESLATMAGTRLKHVWLCHLSEENNNPEIARETVERVLRSYGIVTGVDFELDVLDRKTPMGIYDLK